MATKPRLTQLRPPSVAELEATLQQAYKDCRKEVEGKVVEVPAGAMLTVTGAVGTLAFTPDACLPSRVVLVAGSDVVAVDGKGLMTTWPNHERDKFYIKKGYTYMFTCLPGGVLTVERLTSVDNDTVTPAMRVVPISSEDYANLKDPDPEVVYIITD